MSKLVSPGPSCMWLTNICIRPIYRAGWGGEAWKGLPPQGMGWVPGFIMPSRVMTSMIMLQQTTSKTKMSEMNGRMIQKTNWRSNIIFCKRCWYKMPGWGQMTVEYLSVLWRRREMQNTNRQNGLTNAKIIDYLSWNVIHCCLCCDEAIMGFEVIFVSN